MPAISMAAEAAADILRRIRSGELQISGIQIRESESKKIRYILRGLENQSLDPSTILSTPPLQPLQAAIGLTQLMSAISIAQNAAITMSLKRIEAKLAAMDKRLDRMEGRLQQIDAKLDLMIQAFRSKPASKLRTALNSAEAARRLRNENVAALAAKDADEASKDIIAQARHLTVVEVDAVPVALMAPREIADLVAAGANAATVASSMYLGLGQSEIGGRILRDAADEIRAMRLTLARRLSDPEFLIRRFKAKIASDKDIIAAAASLRYEEEGLRNRAVLIDAGLILPEAEGTDFEAAKPQEGIPLDGVFLEEVLVEDRQR